MSYQLNHTAQEINRKLQLLRDNVINLATKAELASKAPMYSSGTDESEPIELDSGILHFVYEE
jgi:hypothetical protein